MKYQVDSEMRATLTLTLTRQTVRIKEEEETSVTRMGQYPQWASWLTWGKFDSHPQNHYLHKLGLLLVVFSRNYSHFFYSCYPYYYMLALISVSGLDFEAYDLVDFEAQPYLIQIDTQVEHK